MNARDFPVVSRGVDLGFVARQRAKGTPEAAIARMGGWCVADVLAVPNPDIKAVERGCLHLVEASRLRAIDVPVVYEILRHIAQQYLVTIPDILGDSHQQEFVEPRHEAFAVVWELNLFTTAELAEMFNKTVPGITFGLRRHYERINTRGYGRDW